MESLFSFPVGLFHPYNMPVYPGALRVADTRELSRGGGSNTESYHFYGCEFQYGG